MGNLSKDVQERLPEFYKISPHPFPKAFGTKEGYITLLLEKKIRRRVTYDFSS